MSETISRICLFLALQCVYVGLCSGSVIELVGRLVEEVDGLETVDDSMPSLDVKFRTRFDSQNGSFRFVLDPYLNQGRYGKYERFVVKAERIDGGLKIEENLLALNSRREEFVFRKFEYSDAEILSSLVGPMLEYYSGEIFEMDRFPIFGYGTLGSVLIGANSSSLDSFQIVEGQIGQESDLVLENHTDRISVSMGMAEGASFFLKRLIVESQIHRPGWEIRSAWSFENHVELDLGNSRVVFIPRRIVEEKTTNRDGVKVKRTITVVVASKAENLDIMRNGERRGE